MRESERRTLTAFLETLFPRLEPGDGDDPQLFALHSEGVGLPQAFLEAFAELKEADRKDLERLLRMLARPMVMRLLGGPPRPFARLTLAERERVLQRMAAQPLPLMRKGFQAIRRLASFLFYSMPDGAAANPAWPAIGYRPAAPVDAAPATLRLTRITAPETLGCDVCVVGSGAGGGVVAAELAAAGATVIVLEAGPADQAPDYDRRELPGTRRLFLDQGLAASTDLGVSILAGSALGGGTVVNWQTSLRLPAEVRDEWAEVSGLSLFSGREFEASFDAVCARSGVGIAESELNPNNEALRRGCEALGYAWEPIPRNARGCVPEQCGYCMFGCRPGAKQSTDRTFLSDAQRTGDVRIVADCHVNRVVVEGGRATGVEAVARDSNGSHSLSVRARRVVVAAGGIGSPALLLRSGIDLPALGRNLFLHPTSAVGALYAEPVEQWMGPPQTVVCNEFADLGGGYGFRLEPVPGHPGLTALATSWDDARAHRSRMQRYRHLASTIVLVRDRQGGRVLLDRAGRPVIRYRIGAMEHRNLVRGVVGASRVHLAAGAEEVASLRTPADIYRVRDGGGDAAALRFLQALQRGRYDRNRSALFSAHQMGTCRMGEDRKTAVCDENGEVYGVRGLHVADASAFPASSGVNPMITVMALAHHTARRIVAGRWA